MTLMILPREPHHSRAHPVCSQREGVLVVASWSKCDGLTKMALWGEPNDA